MDCAGLQGSLFADCQEWHFQSAKRTDKGSTILQEVRFADAQEKHFQGANVEHGQCHPAISLFC